MRPLPTVLVILAACIAAPPAAAEPPRFAFPVDCTLGRDCWVWAYVDVDPSEAYADYACGTRSYDGHGGTDIALQDEAAMARGVAVRAAAPGIVVGVRDSMADSGTLRTGLNAVKDRECGNGVRIAHGDGWISQYCHLRRGSVRVRKGDAVATGAPLGLIGQSGAAEVPHLHFQVSKDDIKLDPFRGIAEGPACGIGEAPLWREDALDRLTYAPVHLYHAGFAAGKPSRQAYRRGDYDATTLPAGIPALVLWWEGLGLQSGDRWHVRIAGPDGTSVFEKQGTMPRGWAKYFAFAGRKRPPEGFPAGIYAGTVTVEGARAGVPFRVDLTRRIAIQ